MLIELICPKCGKVVVVDDTTEYRATCTECGNTLEYNN